MAVFRVQTGIRFLLPLIVPAVAWIAARVTAAAEPRWRPVLFVVPALIAVESARTWPDALRYVNPLWGGAENGYRVVTDSNFDWGQGLPELARWQQADGRPMAIWYFGTDTRFPELVRYYPGDPNVSRDTVNGRLLAVSASFLYGGYLETPGPANDLIRKLRNQPPVARTSTFVVFDGGY